MANPIVHFEIPTDDLDRAQKFYEQVFGWKISDPWKMEYLLVETKGPSGEGINGGMMRRRSPEQRFMNYLAVVSIETACSDLEAAGGTVVVAKTEIGENMGWIAAFRDTEGNLLGLHEPPPQMRAQAERETSVESPPRKQAAKKRRAKARSKKAPEREAKKKGKQAKRAEKDKKAPKKGKKKKDKKGDKGNKGKQKKKGKRG